ncbi:glycosyltransferase family 4 protein [Backusella circina FSU 941]|nr:glycosyltransferase family 4 protein [Backusella circina FSU 941]
MKIAIITENFLPKVDGVTRTLARLLEHLSLKRHNVVVLGPETGMKQYSGAELVGTFGVPLYFYPELKLNFWKSGFTQKLAEFQPDVIHFVDPVFLGAAGIAVIRNYFPTVPIVSSYHTNLAVYCDHFGWGFLTSIMWKWNRYCHSFSHTIACPSPSTKEILEKNGFKNIDIWPRGVDMSLFSPSHRSEKLRSRWLGISITEAREKSIILYVGRVSYEKNINLVIDAYESMDYSKCHLVLVGHGPAFDEIQKRCVESNMPVTLTGYLQGNDLVEAYASADIFAFPSVTETFGQVVLESMASGLPVVGLQAEGVKDLVDHGNTGLLLDTKGMSHEEKVLRYKYLLNTLITDIPSRKEMSNHAVEEAKRYNWYEAMDCMVDMYERAMGLQSIKKDSMARNDDDEGVSVHKEYLYESSSSSSASENGDSGCEIQVSVFGKYILRWSYRGKDHTTDSFTEC